MANIKQNLTCSRSKPPPARSSCFNTGRIRGIDHLPAMHGAQTQDSQKTSGDKTLATSAGMQVTTAKEVSECLTSWLSYLQMLNGLCNAGSRLSICLGILVQDPSSPCHAIAAQCQAIWEELTRATSLATSAVKTHVVTQLQEINTSSDTDVDVQKSFEQNQQVVCGSLMTFINLQHQFCTACCEFLSAVNASNCCNSNDSRHDPECCVGIIQQCFTRIYSPIPPPAVTSSIQGPQRRWSEAAAAEVSGESSDGTMRRWSMPWEGSRAADHNSSWHGRLNPSKLTVPSTGSQDRSRSTTPDSVWHSSLASQEELQEVIKLLSCKPSLPHSTQLYHPSQHLPGVTLTSYPYDGPPPEWNECSSMLEDRRASGPCQLVSSPQSQFHPQLHRASWHAPDSHGHMWSEHDVSAHGGDRNLEASLSTMDVGLFVSRKSSSSTDSSSSHSLHSRSTTGSENSAEVRAHLYSMWSGSDLSFMKVPESTEPNDGTSQDMNHGSDSVHRFDPSRQHFNTSK